MAQSILLVMVRDPVYSVSGCFVFWHVLVSNSFTFITMARLSANNRDTPSLAGLQSFCVSVRRLPSSGPGSRPDAGISSLMG